MQKYTAYSDITKELLDSIEVGDLIKVNDWKRPLRCKGTTDDYFVMSTKQFGSTCYSVCEKQRWNGGNHNGMVNGKFHVGRDGWIFGSSAWLPFGKGNYDFDNYEATIAYLKTFELPQDNQDHSFISLRSGIPILTIQIKKAAQQ